MWKLRLLTCSKYWWWCSEDIWRCVYGHQDLQLGINETNPRINKLNNYNRNQSFSIWTNYSCCCWWCWWWCCWPAQDWHLQLKGLFTHQYQDSVNHYFSPCWEVTCYCSKGQEGKENRLLIGLFRAAGKFNLMVWKVHVNSLTPARPQSGCDQPVCSSDM